MMQNSNGKMINQQLESSAHPTYRVLTLYCLSQLTPRIEDPRHNN